MNYLCLLPLLLMAACTLQTAGQHVDQPWLDDVVVLDGDSPSSVLHAQSIDKPWLLGAAVPLRKQAVLPAALRSRQTFSFSLETPLPDLDELARRLSLLSDLTVFISPEARLPSTYFLIGTSVGEESESTQQRGLVFEQLRLPELFDQIAAVYSLGWRYQAGRIELYRNETHRLALEQQSGLRPVAGAGAGSLSDRGVK
ncbi:hypothetical protein [Alcaligenes faecalis]|uniref:hypothetical protein n=1 Tax=Alcaligenes faecalis TaxID=511 RepID=UPI001C834D89|nr:hypothetical protein [Alcaligenes faecalis]MBX6963537.1 hypothetical protein [Providencia rettgeri]MBX7030187.1 hypothetical protein [Alcaligenes faecalis]